MNSTDYNADRLSLLHRGEVGPDPCGFALEAFWRRDLLLIEKLLKAVKTPDPRLSVICVEQALSLVRDWDAEVSASFVRQIEKLYVAGPVVGRILSDLDALGVPSEQFKSGKSPTLRYRLLIAIVSSLDIGSPQAFGCGRNSGHLLQELALDIDRFGAKSLKPEDYLTRFLQTGGVGVDFIQRFFEARPDVLVDWIGQAKPRARKLLSQMEKPIFQVRANAKNAGPAAVWAALLLGDALEYSLIESLPGWLLQAIGDAYLRHDGEVPVDYINALAENGLLSGNLLTASNAKRLPVAGVPGCFDF